MKSSPARTSYSFWIGGFLLLCFLHAFAIFRFGERREFQPPPRQIGETLFLGGDAALAERFSTLAGERDPTLFALPHPHGFSGGAWLLFEPEAPKLSNWSAPSEWLALPAEQLGNSFNDYLATNRPSDEPLLASLRVSKTLEVRIPGELVLTNTTVRIEGPLALRGLVRAPRLFPVNHTDALRAPTVVAVSVNGDGVVETASVLNSSWLKAADDFALPLARQFEFKPLPIRNVQERENAPPTLGRLLFTWHVVLNVTNNVPAQR